MKHEILKSLALLIVAFVAASIVMILHELMKAIAYSIYIKIYNKKYKQNEICTDVFKVHRYIDPIGIILAITHNGIFSKQHSFVIRSKKASFLIGFIGYITLALTFIISVIIYRNVFLETIVLPTDNIYIGYLVKCIKILLEYISLYSITLLIVNLYPIATFDISLIIATISPSAYINIRKFDLFIKLGFLILALSGIFSTTGVVIAAKALGY